ncbi:MAG: hypothetical protein M1824_004376 [Vezdaea acicularis]|nr:MAG: hypothetical protein M1824_004376 [Vezdaea acicularis]
MYLTSSFFAISILLSFVAAIPPNAFLNRRAQCNADNVLRALRGRSDENRASASAFCSGFLYTGSPAPTVTTPTYLYTVPETRITSACNCLFTPNPVVTGPGSSLPTPSLPTGSGIFPTLPIPTGSGVFPTGSGTFPTGSGVFPTGSGVFPTLPIPTGWGIFPTGSAGTGTGTAYCPTGTAPVTYPKGVIVRRSGGRLFEV